MDYEGPLQVVEQLVASTKSRLKFTKEITDAVNVLNEMLLTDATGFSLDELYKRIPEPLKGFVELGYDPGLGARPLKRAILKHVQDPLAEALVAGRVAEGGTVRVRAPDGRILIE